MDAASPHILLFRDGRPKDWHRAADVLQGALPGVNRGLIIRSCRKGMGLVPIPLSCHLAMVSCQALTAAGFTAVSIHLNQVIEAPAAFLVSNAEVCAEGLMVRTHSGTLVGRLPWESLCAIKVANVRPQRGGTSTTPTTSFAWKSSATPQELKQAPVLASSNLLEAGLEIAAYAATAFLFSHSLVGTLYAETTIDNIADQVVPFSTPEERKPADPEVWLELYCLEPLIRLRVRRHQFSYSYLAERMHSTSNRNFQLLVEDIVRHAVNAAHLGAVDAAVTAGVVDGIANIIDEEDHDRHVTAMLTHETILGLPRPLRNV